MGQWQIIMCDTISNAFSSIQCRTFSRSLHETNNPIKYEPLPYNWKQATSPHPTSDIIFSFNRIISSTSALDRHAIPTPPYSFPFLLAFSVGTIFRVLDEPPWYSYTVKFLCLIKMYYKSRLYLKIPSGNNSHTTSGPSYVVQQMNPSTRKMDSGEIISRPVFSKLFVFWIQNRTKPWPVPLLISFLHFSRNGEAVSRSPHLIDFSTLQFWWNTILGWGKYFLRNPMYQHITSCAC